MSSFKECLSNIIGLTPSKCECLNFPEDWDACNESWTGNYIHGDMEFSVPLQVPAKGNCDEGSAVATLKQAREQAIECFIDLYTIELEKLQKKTFENYSDKFGEWKNNSPISYLNGDWVGFNICPDTFYKGAVVCLQGGTLSINCPDTIFDVHVVKLNEIDPSTNEPVIVHTQQVQGGVQSHFMMDVSLPLYVNGKKCNYAVVYDRKGCNPYDVKFDCGCSSSGKKPIWQQKSYFKCRGLQAADLASVPYSNIQSDTTHGLCIDFTLKCDGLSWLCGLDKDFWCNNAWGRIAARVLVLIANMKLIGKMCQPGALSFATVVDAESLYKKNAWLNKRLEALMPYLAQKTPTDISHCYLCSPSGGFKIQNHLV